MIMKDALLRDRNNTTELDEKQNKGWRGRAQHSHTKAPWNLNPLLWESFLCVGLLLNYFSCCISALLGSCSNFHCKSSNPWPGSVTTSNRAGGRLVLTSWRGPQSISELGKPATTCPRLSQPDVVNKPINHFTHQQDVSGEGRCLALLGTAMLHSMELTKILNFSSKGLLFSIMISPPFLPLAGSD